MTQDEIIRMARDAGFARYMTDGEINWKMFERFAALVAAHERNRHAWTQEHWTQYEHAIAAGEREACAKVCEQGTGEAVQKPTLKILFNERKRIAKAILNRGDE